MIWEQAIAELEQANLALANEDPNELTRTGELLEDRAMAISQIGKLAQSQSGPIPEPLFDRLRAAFEAGEATRQKLLLARASATAGLGELNDVVSLLRAVPLELPEGLHRFHLTG